MKRLVERNLRTGRRKVNESGGYCTVCKPYYPGNAYANESFGCEDLQGTICNGVEAQATRDIPTYVVTWLDIVQPGQKRPLT
jgi:hypothetical protein